MPQEIPPDIVVALRTSKAEDKFNKLPPSHQKEWLLYISEAKKPETRDRRVKRLLEALTK